ncbi:MAG: hypothetical protein PHG18_03870 [Bacilli bacterium]|nr:hypothetical protein [Bacilli bacterium]
MKNKILIELIVPEIEETYNLYIPVNKKIGNIIILITRAIFDISSGTYSLNNNCSLYNRENGKKYEPNDLVRLTDIRNGSSLILM